MNLLRGIALSLLCVGVSLAGTVRVGAAISLKDSLEKVAAAYEANGGGHVELVFGASGQILSQIKNGAGIDAFISAANAQVDALAKDKLIDADSRRVVVSNDLVLVVPLNATDTPKDFAALANVAGKFAVGEPKTVPAGQYATQVFEHLTLTASLRNRLVYGTNVRQVLAYVERGEVAAGVVYATDAKQAGDVVKVTAVAPADSHEPIVYPAVVIAASVNKDAARKFLDYLGTPAARAEFQAAGFGVPAAASAGK